MLRFSSITLLIYIYTAAAAAAADVNTLAAEADGLDIDRYLDF